MNLEENAACQWQTSATTAATTSSNADNRIHGDLQTFVDTCGCDASGRCDQLCTENDTMSIQNQKQDLVLFLCDSDQGRNNRGCHKKMLSKTGSDLPVSMLIVNNFDQEQQINSLVGQVSRDR